jgi:hypothetical protein
MNPIKRFGLWSLALSLSALTLAACSRDSGGESVAYVESNSAKVLLNLDYSEVPLMDSLVLDCYGADTLHLVKGPDQQQLELDLFPHQHWVFSAKLYANGNLMQKGEVEAKLEAGKTTEVSLKMHALAGFIYLRIPLGFGNPANIAYGQMELRSADSLHTYLMEMDGSDGVFHTDLLPLETAYTLKITLYDSQDNSIYQVEDSLFLSQDTPVPSLELKSLRGKVQLSLDFSSEVNLEAVLHLPAGRRAPNKNELIVSEFFSAPLKSDSSQYEFIEIYNGSIDTLLLDGCTIGTGSTGSKAWEITASEIVPGAVLVFGDSSANTPNEFRNTATWGDLTNTKSSIVLQCGGTILDSLFYSNADSLQAVPNYSTPTKNPQSSHLDLSQWENRSDGSAWSLGSPSPGTLDK